MEDGPGQTPDFLLEQFKSKVISSRTSANNSNRGKDDKKPCKKPGRMSNMQMPREKESKFIKKIMDGASFSVRSTNEIALSKASTIQKTSSWTNEVDSFNWKLTTLIIRLAQLKMVMASYRSIV